VVLQVIFNAENLQGWTERRLQHKATGTFADVASASVLFIQHQSVPFDVCVKNPALKLDQE